jgi:tetratricopeptide (TPR) repeat protein
MVNNSEQSDFSTSKRLRWLATNLKLPRPVFEFGVDSEVKTPALNQAVKSLEETYGTGVLSEIGLESALELNLNVSSMQVGIVGQCGHAVLPMVEVHFGIPPASFAQLFFSGEEFQPAMLRILLRDMVWAVWNTYAETTGLKVKRFRDTPSFPLFDAGQDPEKILFEGDNVSDTGKPVSFRRFLGVKSGALKMDISILESTLLFEAGRIPEALEQILAMISGKAEVDDPGILNTLAKILISTGEMDKAIKYLTLILEKNPSSAGANFLLGKLYLKLSVDNPELIKTAHKHLKAAIQVRPGNLEFQFVFALALARIYGHTDKRTLAVNYYKKMLQYSRPDCQLATMMEYDLGKLLFRIGSYSEAADHFARINNYYRTYGVLPTNSVYVESSDHNEILAEVNLFAATCYRQLGDMKKALAYSKKVMEVAPESPLAFFEQGLIQKAEEKYDEAIKSFETCLGKSPSIGLKAELGYHLAEAYLFLIGILGDDPVNKLKEEDWEKRELAIDSFRLSIEADPQGDNRWKILDLVAAFIEEHGEIGRARFNSYFRSLMGSEPRDSNRLLILLCDSIFLPVGSASSSGQALKDILVYLRDRLPGASSDALQTVENTRARDIFLRLAEIAYYYDGPSKRVALAFERFLKGFAPKFPQTLHYPTVNGMINFMNQEELYRVIPKASERSLAKVLLGGRLSTRYLIMQNCSRAKGRSLLEEMELLQGKARVPDRESERDLENLIIEAVYRKKPAKVRQEGISFPAGEIYYLFGLSLLEAGDYEKAMKAFSRAPEFLDSVEPELEAASFEYLRGLTYLSWCRDHAHTTENMRAEMAVKAKALFKSVLDKVEDEFLRALITTGMEEVDNLSSTDG